MWVLLVDGAVTNKTQWRGAKHAWCVYCMHIYGLHAWPVPPGPSPTHQSPPQLATPTSIYLLASWTMAWPWPSIDRFVDVPMLRSESTTYTESWYLPRGPSFWLFPPGPRLMLPFACLHACTGCWAHWNRRADRAFFPLLTAVAWRPLLCGRAARLLHDAC